MSLDSFEGNGIIVGTAELDDGELGVLLQIVIDGEPKCGVVVIAALAERVAHELLTRARQVAHAQKGAPRIE